MLSKVVVLGLLLVVLFPACLAAVDVSNPGNTPLTAATVDQANKYLAAETTRQIRALGDELQTNLKAYQDENFMALDQRMTYEMGRMQKTLVFGGLGVLLVGNAIVALFLIRQFRQYSYEKYQDDIIKTQRSELKLAKESQTDRGLQQMQQPVWAPQVPTPTMSMKFGQAQASDMTQMNQWQSQPAYAGSWSSPVDVQREQYAPMGYEEKKKPVWMQSPYDSTPSWQG